jgi:hypothetical protein
MNETASEPVAARDPLEDEIDALLEEHGGDARAAIRALLHDLDMIARDVSRGYARGGLRVVPRNGKA